MSKESARKFVRCDSNFELFRIILMLLIIAHHFIETRNYQKQK